MLRASSRYQLLFGPATTPGGAVYQRLPGMPASALETKVWTPGEATNTPSEPYFMKWRVAPIGPTHRADHASGGNVVGAPRLGVVVGSVFAAPAGAFPMLQALPAEIQKPLRVSAPE